MTTYNIDVSNKENAILESTINRFPTNDQIKILSRVEIMKDSSEVMRETGKKKFQKRLLAVSKYRVLYFKKVPIVKTYNHDGDFKIVNLKEISEGVDNDSVQLVFATERVDDPDHCLSIKSKNLEDIVRVIRESYRDFSYGWHDIYDINWSSCPEPADNHAPISICHGFLDTYMAYCDHDQTVPQSQFIQYIEDLERKGITDLDLTLCPGVHPRSALTFDLVTIGKALSQNTYFTSFTISDVTNKSAMTAVSHILSKNVTMTRISCTDTNSSTLADVGLAIENNPNLKLHIMDFEGNDFRSDAEVSIAKSFRSISRLVPVLNLARCEFAGRGLHALFLAFRTNWGFSLGIQELDISRSPMNSDASDECIRWCSDVKTFCSLTRLNLAYTSVNIGTLCLHMAEMKGLSYIDLSGNKFDKYEYGNLPALCSASSTLEVIRAADCSLPVDTIEDTLRALFGNPSLHDIWVDISSNGIGAKGGEKLGDAMRQSSNLWALDISNNSLKSGAVPLLQNLSSNVRRLILDNNFTNSSGMDSIATAVSSLLSSRPNLEYISVAGNSGNRLQNRIANMFVGIGNNPTLTELDVSGNQMGDEAFAHLCDELRSNVGLKTLKIDHNDISLNGYLCFYHMLDFNDTLQKVEYPINDFAKSNLDIQYLSVLTQIQQKLAGRELAPVTEDKFPFRCEWGVPTGTPKDLLNVPQVLVDVTVSPEELLNVDTGKKRGLLKRGTTLMDDAPPSDAPPPPNPNSPPNDSPPIPGPPGDAPPIPGPPGDAPPIPGPPGDTPPSPGPPGDTPPRPIPNSPPNDSPPIPGPPGDAPPIPGPPGDAPPSPIREPLRDIPPIPGPPGDAPPIPGPPGDAPPSPGPPGDAPPSPGPPGDTPPRPIPSGDSLPPPGPPGDAPPPPGNSLPPPGPPIDSPPRPGPPDDAPPPPSPLDNQPFLSRGRPRRSAGITESPKFSLGGQRRT